MPTRRQKAQSVIEFAFVALFLVIFALGLLDFGRVFYANVNLVNAAREGARQAVLLAPGFAGVDANVKTVIQAESIDPFSGNVPSSSILPVQHSSDRCTVTISEYPFQPVTPFIGDLLGDKDGIIRLSASATFPVMSP